MPERRFDIITFDCYGTLIDWEGGIGEAFAGLNPALRKDAVLSAYGEVEAAVEHEGFRDYRDVLTKTAVELTSRLGVAIDERQASFLPESLPSWRPFPDTNQALERLVEAGYRLGILSNVDDGLLEETRRHFTVDFDLIVTAQQVRSYKPGEAHFIEARRRLGDARWLHAAQSNYHDVAPAKALGIPVAWINRKGAAVGGSGVAPDWEFTNLRELADWLA